MALNDSKFLGTDLGFMGRVQASLLAACVAIANEGTGVNNHRDRLQLVHSVLSNPTNLTNYAQLFALSVATDSTAVSQVTAAGTVPLDATNVITRQSLVTDATITSTVSAHFNAYCSGIPV